MSLLPLGLVLDKVMLRRQASHVPHGASPTVSFSLRSVREGSMLPLLTEFLSAVERVQRLIGGC